MQSFSCLNWLGSGHSIYVRPLNHFIKGGFFSESAMCFFKSPNLQKKIFQKTILSLKFKFQVQDSFLEYFFWRFGDLKNTSDFLKKKPHLQMYDVVYLNLALYCSLFEFYKCCIHRKFYNPTYFNPRSFEESLKLYFDWGVCSQR